MPKHPHEAIVQLIGESPAGAVRSLRTLGIPLPHLPRIGVADSDLTRVLPVSRRADSVLLLTDRPRRRRFFLVVEVQMRRNWRKPRRWHSYLAAAGDEHGCAGLLIVMTPDRRVARWAARERPIDPLHTWSPVVIGPSQLPGAADVDRLSRNPLLAVLTGLACARNPEQVAVLKAVYQGLRQSVLPVDAVGYYWEVILLAAAPAVLAELGSTMDLEDYKPQTEFGRRFFGRIARSRAEGRVEGKVEGKAEFLLDVLEERGLKVTAADRARILACQKPVQLRTWLRRAVTAESTRQVFEGRRRSRRD